MIFRSKIIFILMFFNLGGVGFSQVFVEEPNIKYQNDEYGFTMSVAQQGIGLGTFYLKMLGNHSYLGAFVDFYKMRDKYEYSYYYLGYPRSSNKENSLYLVPFGVDLKHDFMTETFSNDIRPSVFLKLGGIFGMNFPQTLRLVDFETFTVTEIKKPNQYRMGTTFGGGVSLDIANQKKVFFSIQAAYNWVYFPQEIAGKMWHNNYELKLVVGLKK